MSKWVSYEDFRKQFPINARDRKRGLRRVRDAIDGVKLSELRIEKDLTQVQIAKRLKIDQSNVSRIERGTFSKIEISTLRRYIEALGGELEIRIRIGQRSEKLIDSEYEKWLDSRLAKTPKTRTSTRRSPRSASVAKVGKKAKTKKSV